MLFGVVVGVGEGLVGAERQRLNRPPVDDVFDPVGVVGDRFG
jgi:hypothetical protein